MKKKWEVLYLSQEDCVAAGGADMSGTMKAVERSFMLHGLEDFIQPGKPVIRWGGPETEETTGRIMSMPSWLGGGKCAELLKEKTGLPPVNTAGIKYIPSRPWNPKKYGLPRASAIIIILDPETLHPVCVMDGAIASAMRTGAASGVAIKYLGNPDSKVMGLIGSSVQAKTQIMAFKEGCPNLEVCKVYSPTRANAEKFAKDMSDKAKMEIIPVDSPKEAFADADVISTATMARKSYVDPGWYKEGSTHTEISFWDTPPSALSVFDRIFVDDWFQVQHHGVDVSARAVKEGFIREDKISGNLGEVVCGKKQGRLSSEDKIFFNPIGMGIHDLSEAFRVYENAKTNGIGRVLPLFEDADGWLEKLK